MSFNVVSFIKRATNGAVPVADDQPLPVTSATAAEGATLAKASITMSGSSGALVSASAARLIVMVSNALANAVAAVDPTGGTCALDAGVPIPPGQTVTFTGKAAQSAMTQIGTNSQKLTVYTG